MLVEYSQLLDFLQGLSFPRTKKRIKNCANDLIYRGNNVWDNSIAADEGMSAGEEEKDEGRVGG